ncbi:hypothetical protein [Tateyamaria sp. syn59]|uniref:MmyB family transcriptional regulator n=1 Tax=Tateyamaria sp. syn59 TaxID=2576942 RepID=UPI0011BFCC17|nr:hypothetical protein [Tateyamaria sp. syn59]
MNTKTKRLSIFEAVACFQPAFHLGAKTPTLHAPYPAVSIDRIWNLLKANEPFKKFFALIGARGDTNLLREMLAPGPVRDSIQYWLETARALLRFLDLEVARRPLYQFVDCCTFCSFSRNML